MPNSLFRTFFAACVMASCAMTVAWAVEQPVFHPVPGSPLAPKFRLPDINDKQVSLQQLHGKVVVVNFWATWCPPCRREMPSLQRLWEKQGGKAGLRIVAVNVGEDADTVHGFAGTMDTAPSFTIVFDKDSAVMRSWPIKGLPTTLLLDRKGRIVYRAIGGREFDSPDSIALINRLLAEPPPAARP